MTETAPDPDEFIGEPPAGDADPGAFMSNDQSAGIPQDEDDNED